MRVAQINATYGVGSTGGVVRDIDQYLVSLGHDSLALTSSSCVESSTVRVYDDQLDRKVHALMSRVTGRQACYSISQTKKMLRELDLFEPDVVLLHNLHSNFVSFPRLMEYLGSRGIPVVLYLHDCWFFTGKCSHYNSSNCMHWKQRCGCCPRLDEDIPSFFFDRTEEMIEEKARLYSKCDSLGVVGVSDWVLSEASKGILGCAKYKRRVYNWVDLEIFRPVGAEVKKSLGIKGKMILCVSSSWGPDSKRLENLFAVSELMRDGETLVVIGDMAGQSLPSSVIKVGRISDPTDLARYYSSADVYLHLSEEDTFGKVIAEALACDTPCVTFDSTAYPELVASPQNGRAVRVGDLSALRDAVDFVLYSDVFLPGARRKFASDCFDKRKLLPSLFEFVQEVSGCC